MKEKDETGVDEAMISTVWVMHGGNFPKSRVCKNVKHGDQCITIIGTIKLKKDDGQSFEVTGLRGHRHSWRNKNHPLTIHIDGIRVSGEWIQDDDLMPLGFEISNKNHEKSDGYCYQVSWA